MPHTGALRAVLGVVLLLMPTVKLSSASTLPSLLCALQFELTGLPPGSPAITEITWDGKTSVISTDEDILLEVQRIMDSIGGEASSIQCPVSGVSIPVLFCLALDRRRRQQTGASHQALCSRPTVDHIYRPPWHSHHHEE